MVASKYAAKEVMGEEEQELDLEEEDSTPRVVDLLDNNYYFREVRIVLSQNKY